MHSSANFFEANLGIASYGSIVASEPLNVCCVALKSPTVVRTTAASPLCPARRINKSRYIVNTRGTLKLYPAKRHSRQLPTHNPALASQSAFRHHLNFVASFTATIKNYCFRTEMGVTDVDQNAPVFAVKRVQKPAYCSWLDGRS